MREGRGARRTWLWAAGGCRARFTPEALKTSSLGVKWVIWAADPGRLPNGPQGPSSTTGPICSPRPSLRPVKDFPLAFSGTVVTCDLESRQK